MSATRRLPGPVADELANRALKRAVASGVLPDHPLPDWAAFRAFRQKVRDAFEVPQTSITPLMARLLYGIAYVARPVRLLVVGSYFGNALVWLYGPGFGPFPAYEGRYAGGVDVDESSVAGSRANFARLGADRRLDLRVLDGHRVGAAEDSFDLVLLDADDTVRRKSVYLTLLEALYPQMAADGLLLAHDICVPQFVDQLTPYREAVRDRHRFAGSISLEIDACGVEVSRRRERP